jgi:hypothetical protein
LIINLNLSAKNENVEQLEAKSKLHSPKRDKQKNRS